MNLCDSANFGITNDPLINITGTIAITDTPNGFNLEVAQNSIRSENIVDGGINGDDIQDNSIGESKLGDDSVGNDELRDNAVGTAEVEDFSLQPQDLATALPNQVLGTDQNGQAQWQDALNLQRVETDA